MPAAEQVQVKMEDGLACASAVVHHCAVAFGEIALAGELRRDHLEAAQEQSVGWRGVAERLDVLARADQDVRGRLRVDVFEGEDLVVLADKL